MRKVFVILALCAVCCGQVTIVGKHRNVFAPPSGGAAPAYVGQCNNSANFSPTSCAYTVPSDGLTHTLVIGVSANNTPAVSSISGCTATFVASQASVGLLNTAFAYICPNVTSGAKTIRVVWTGGDSRKSYLSVVDYSGTAASPLDGYAVGNCETSCATTFTTASLTTTVANDRLWAFGLTATGATFTAGSGFTARTSPSGGLGVALVEDQVAASAGSNTASFTNTSQNAAFAVTLALKGQ